MQIDIVSKLNDLFLHIALEDRYISEPETLYVLAQVRKLSERLTETEYAKYPALFFYCDWALHTKLDRSPVKKILEDLGKNWVSGWGPNKKEDFFGFITFKDELVIFFENTGISTGIIVGQDEWFEFRRNLIQILIDTPLERTDTRIVKFSLLKYSTDNGLPTDDYHYWYEVIFNSGEVEQWNVMLADYGLKRKSQIKAQNKVFFQVFIHKMKYKRMFAERNKKSDPKILKSEEK